MNVLLLDQTGSFLDFALRVNAAGHYARVCMAIEKDTGKPYKGGDGLVEKVKPDDWPKHMAWADLVMVSDNTKWLGELEVFKKKGYPILAPTRASAALELDRMKGQELFKKAGIKIADYELFNDYKKAEKYVLAEMKRFVSKPSGDADKALSYVAKSPADMIFMLRRWEQLNKLKAPFILQEFVGGIEFAVNGWLGPKGFCEFVCENFEHKKLMNDDKGPNTGEMGTVLRYTNRSILAAEVLLPLEKELMKLGHTGAIDVSVIIDDNGEPRPLEFTARPSWPGNNIQSVLHPEPVEWLAALCDGQDIFRPSLETACGVVITIPDFPYSKLTKKEVSGIPVYHLDASNPYRELILPCEVEAGMAPAMEGDEVVDRRVMTSTGDYLAVCSGTGTNVREACTQAYKTVESLEVPNSLMYRTDIGDRLKKELPKLQEFGFALDWVY